LSLSALDPASVPDVIISLMSTDKKLAADADGRLQELLKNAKAPDVAYFSNVLFVIKGKVAEIEALQAKMTDRVAAFESINEEGALVIGTLATALTQLGDIALMTALAGATAAGIKLVFSAAKFVYKNQRRNDLEAGTHESLTQATNECVGFYNAAYRPANAMNSDAVLPTLGTKANFLAKRAF
jgi:hypothetical protein